MIYQLISTNFIDQSSICDVDINCGAERQFELLLNQNMTATLQLTEVYYSSLATDPDLSEIVEMFVDEMPGRTRDLQQQFSTQDWDQLARLAHQLKGAAGSYGFDQITPYAARLEKAIRNGLPMGEIQTSYQELLEACGRIRSGAAK
jgi:histidine phosphotransfer protein HptB